MIIHSSQRYKNQEHFHKTIKDAFEALDVALRGDLPDPDTEKGHFEIVALRAFVDRLDWALIRGLSKTMSSQPRPASPILEVTFEDLGI